MLGGPGFQAQLLSTEACSLSLAPVLTAHWGGGGVPKDSPCPLPRGTWCGVAPTWCGLVVLTANHQLRSLGRESPLL